MSTTKIMNSSYPQELIAYQDEEWTILRLENHQHAIDYGRKEWCTGRTDNDSYNRIYRDLGSLFAFFKATKTRPQYQIFFSKYGIEFRNGGNISVCLETWLTANPNLRTFVDQQKQQVKAGSILEYDQALGRILRQGESSPTIVHLTTPVLVLTARDALASKLETLADARSVMSQQLQDMIIEQLRTPVFVGDSNERPQNPELGTMYYDHEQGCILIYTNSWHPLPANADGEYDEHRRKD